MEVIQKWRCLFPRYSDLGRGSPPIVAFTSVYMAVYTWQYKEYAMLEYAGAARVYSSTFEYPENACSL